MEYILTIRKREGYWICSYDNDRGESLCVCGKRWYVGKSIEGTLTKLCEALRRMEDYSGIEVGEG